MEAQTTNLSIRGQATLLSVSPVTTNLDQGPGRLASLSTMPDLNTVPASPHALAHSRRQSSQQVPVNAPTNTSAPDSSLNILPSNQDAVNHPSHSSPEPPAHTMALQPSTDGQSTAPDASVGSGPGPLRHPRPLTASELHMELEKEQEAVVCSPLRHGLMVHTLTVSR